MTELEFTKRAIRKLRKRPYNGIHTVYSGFNQAFREYFDKDPVEATNQLAEQGLLEIKPVKGGVMIYIPDDKPYQSPKTGKTSSALKKILED